MDVISVHVLKSNTFGSAAGTPQAWAQQDCDHVVREGTRVALLNMHNVGCRWG